MHGDLPRYITKTRSGKYSVRVPRFDSKKRIRLGTFETLEQAISVKEQYLAMRNSEEPNQPNMQSESLLDHYSNLMLPWQQEVVKIEIPFRKNAVGYVFFSDLHFGASGTLYNRIKEDTEEVTRNRDMRVIMYGDLIDNFVVGRLQALQRTQAMPHRDELKLAREWLTAVKPQLDLLVAGNHDLWTDSVSGVSLYEYLFLQRNEDFPFYYHPYELVADLIAPHRTYNMVVRHKWRGNSRKNPTIGIENSWEERPQPFDIGVMGHYHVASLYRQFVKQQRVRHAIITGTYKLGDDYPMELGLPTTVGVGSGVLIFIKDEADPIWCSSVKTAGRVLRSLNGGYYG